MLFLDDAFCIVWKAPTGAFMFCSRIPGSRWCFFLICLFLVAPAITARQSSQQPDTSVRKDKAVPAPGRGQKLILKDGTYQLIREYQRNGDHVRYFSTERGDWEEVPASMVDWDATAKAAAESEKAFASEVEKVHKLEEAKRMDNVSDVDASLLVGNGVFLPDGEGMFVVEGKSIRVLDQAASTMKTDKLRTIEKVMSPVPIVPGKQNLVLPGARAKLRLRSATPEFYLREAPPDPDRLSRIQRSSRPGESGPDVALIRTKVTKNSRQIESISTLFGQEISENRNSISVQRWEVAPSVYRFTLSQPLPPGEYVITEILPDGLDLFVWEFGLDAEAAAGTKK
jgi:hypothetical protein